MFFAKQASANDRGVAVDIMNRILHEEPTYWPYGLNLDQFDGGLYLISKSASEEPVGFVGWQERQEGGRNIGYYAIGVLPEHRRQGFAKQAVQVMLQEKSANVDEVRALVCSHNQPSQSLAKSLPGVNLTIFEKSAMTGKARVAAHLLGALGTAAFADQAADPEGRSLSSTLQPWKWDKQRGLMGAMNLGLGALAGNQVAERKIVPALTSFALAPTKDLVLKSMGSLSKLDKLSDTASEAISRPPATPASWLSQIPKPLLLGALGVGAGGLGLAAYAAKKKSDNDAAQLEASRAGRVRVTLPTKAPGDAETVLDLPVEDIKLSNALRSRLGRDTRRRLYSETKQRTARRKPKNPDQPTEKELEDAALDEEEAMLDKEAAILPLLQELDPVWFLGKSAGAMPQPTVPSPPGGSPAMKMQQQQAQANSIDTSTTANPQIAKAQQEAAEASMQAQQQVAQAEQSQQQLVMQKDEERRQQLAQADQQKQQVEMENQMLKMQLEKTKIESDLERAKHKAHSELSDARSAAEGSQSGAHDERLSKLISSRLDRVRKRMAKSATLDPTTGQPEEDQSLPLNPTTGQRETPEPKVYRPMEAQNINDNGMSFMAAGHMPQVGLYRASYGPIGDFVYKNLLRPNALRPSHATLSGAAAFNNPDKLGMISSISDQAQSWWRQPNLE